MDVAESEILFGFSDVSFLVGKARRDYERYLASPPTGPDRIDCALNLVNTINSISDWFYHSVAVDNDGPWPKGANRGEFLRWARSQSDDLKLVLDIANVSKHLNLRDGRKSKITELTTGKIIYEVYYPWAEEFVERIKPLSLSLEAEEIRVVGQRKAKKITSETHIVRTEEGFHMFADVCNRAIGFWEEMTSTH